jgi:hypothetical protein
MFDGASSFFESGKSAFELHERNPNGFFIKSISSYSGTEVAEEGEQSMTFITCVAHSMDDFCHEVEVTRVDDSTITSFMAGILRGSCFFFAKFVFEVGIAMDA